MEYRNDLEGVNRPFKKLDRFSKWNLEFALRKEICENRDVMLILERIINEIILEFTIISRLFKENNKELQATMN